MFDRKKYKNYALKMLKGRWKVPVLMALAIFLVTEIFSWPTVIQLAQTPEGQSLLQGDFSTVEEFYTLFTQASLQVNTEVLDIIQGIVEAILSFAALSVYLKLTRSPEKVAFKTFIEGFNNWWKAFLGFLWQTLWVFLWCFLFIIPGIIKYISYSQMFMIMNEFEGVSVTKSMRISMIITRGHKWDIFVMALSFIGWDILSVLTLGIAQLWINPYKQVTYMNAFHAMLKESLENGSIKPEDLQ